MRIDLAGGRLHKADAIVNIAPDLTTYVVTRFNKQQSENYPYGENTRTNLHSWASFWHAIARNQPLGSHALVLHRSSVAGSPAAPTSPRGLVRGINVTAEVSLSERTSPPSTDRSTPHSRDHPRRSARRDSPPLRSRLPTSQLAAREY